jgi:5-formyltetrahydrofolate cyclo-ligase
VVPKEHLRAVMRARRGSLSLAERTRRVVPILTELIGSDAWAHARTVLVYAAVRGEPPLAELVALARETGRTVVLPRVEGDTLALHVWPPGAVLVRGALGVGEPDAAWPSVACADVDLALVPGLAFDARGGRLGQGGGYYDRLLQGLRVRPGATWPRTIGVAWGFQILPQVPEEPHDARVDAVLTEDGWVRCAAGG